MSVPDATTLTDRLYRWLARGGGHVNPFTSPEQVIEMVERSTHLKCRATRILCSSLSFLNRRNAPLPPPKRLFLLGGGTDTSLLLYSWLSRRMDRWFGFRTSIYGWAFYFGHVKMPIDTATHRNVCILCGSGFSARFLDLRGYLLPLYKCPECGANNVFSLDY